MSKTELFLIGLVAAVVAVPLIDYVASKLGITALQA